MNNKTAVSPYITAYFPVAKAVSQLFYPHLEAVVHDLTSGRIVCLYGSFSRRGVGDLSAFSELHIETTGFPDVFEPYEKINWDGKKLKCISVTIRDSARTPIGLLCLNFDTSVFASVKQQLEAFITVPDETRQNPIEQFTENWQQQVTDFIDTYLRDNHVTLKTLTKEQKRTLINELYRHGLFHYRKAAGYIAEQLNVSRATIYNYLKEEQ